MLKPSTKSKASTSILKQGTLPAPLPTTVVERMDREAAYEKTKEEGAKWAGVMKRIKEAQHLSFPLQASDRGGVKSSGEMLSTYKPQPGLESAVDALLRSANLTEDGVQRRENEALESQELTLEELEARRKKLREQRELMFRAESRAKRVAKIKSKTFRKLARKRAARAGGVEGEEALDAMDAEERAEALERAEMERARERATLKHGARTSRWSRQAGTNGMGDGDEGRQAKEEMLRQKERLSRRTHGKGDESSEEESMSSADDEADEEGIKARAFDQLARVDTEEGEGKEGGLMGMAFMKKARERQKRKAVEEEEGLKKDIELFGDLDEDSQEEPNEAGDDEDEDRNGNAVMMNIGGTGGRMVFSGPKVSDLLLVHADL